MAVSDSWRVPHWTSVLVLGCDDRVVEITRAALSDSGMPGEVHQVGTSREALSALLAPGTPPSLLILPDDLDDRGLQVLHAAAIDPFGPTRMVLLRGVSDEPSASGVIRAALQPRQPSPGLDDDGDRLRQGLQQGSIVLRYQPIVRIADRRPVGVEALARWVEPPEHLTPERFVPLAEREGLGRDLSMAVVGGAAREFAALQHEGQAPPRMSVNLPLSVLLEADARSWLARIVGRAGLKPRDVVLELTETMQVRDHSVLGRALRRLQGAGFAVVLDDLSPEADRDEQLDLPFDGFKLDRGLVAAMPRSRAARARVERLMARAARMGMTVTAEGVADARLWRAVETAGVHFAQGFAIGRPVPADVLSSWVQAWRSAWVQPRSRRGFPV
ncbi:EAL domain-containing protein [Roseomonas sp. OT10]|uniref:EAL domain-containing protein n=1 Tax=Roseomonas cutis TaxID=2897332 RepID=UPI001E2DB9CC|nr:EAL domain-containing protein [Roseomonas sp. OT10]UFN49721.1 EAL domain-containing protein [Roseomonas sp. OT10]